MSTLLNIGDFSRMTYLSVKALRHYHETGLLEPADIDPASGYRLYDTSQVSTGQVIRRFRELGMPIEQVKAVLQAPDVPTRNRVIVAHLQRMEADLEHTRATVASLRALLERPQAQISVTYRSVPATPSLAIAEPVSMSDMETWWLEAFEELCRALKRAAIKPAGPPGALYSSEFFEVERGQVVAFVPVVGAADASGRATRFEVPGTELAIALHAGPFGELDQTYGALGTFVAERALGVEGPIREHYLVSARDTDDETCHRTEVCWPIFHTRAASGSESNA